MSTLQFHKKIENASTISKIKPSLLTPSLFFQTLLGYSFVMNGVGSYITIANVHKWYKYFFTRY